jgi:hypothetical protein
VTCAPRTDGLLAGFLPLLGVASEPPLWMLQPIRATHKYTTTSPLNRSINKPTNQQTNKPTNQQTNKPTNQQTNKPTSKQTKRAMKAIHAVPHSIFCKYNDQRLASNKES